MTDSCNVRKQRIIQYFVTTLDVVFTSMTSLIRIKVLPLLILADCFLSKRVEVTQTCWVSVIALGCFVIVFLSVPSKG